MTAQTRFIVIAKSPDRSFEELTDPGRTAKRAADPCSLNMTGEGIATDRIDNFSSRGAPMSRSRRDDFSPSIRERCAVIAAASPAQACASLTTSKTVSSGGAVEPPSMPWSMRGVRISSRNSPSSPASRAPRCRPAVRRRTGGVVQLLVRQRSIGRMHGRDRRFVLLLGTASKLCGRRHMP
jgi:hypothetical protein